MRKNKKGNNEGIFNKLKNKKADMTSKQLISIILIIAGFAIIILIYTSIEWDFMTDQEICRLSVTARATPGTLPGIPEGRIGDLIPLQCKTEKVCVRGSRFVGRGECKDFRGEEEITYEDVRTVRDVERVIADKTAECWEMMGKGELSLFAEGWGTYFGVREPTSSCVVCARIAFDEESLKERNVNLSEMNVERYMMTHTMPGKDYTYYEFFREGLPTLEIPEEFEFRDPVKGEDVELIEEESRRIARDIEEEDFSQEMAIIFMQVAAPGHGDVFKRTVGYGAFAGGIVGFGRTAKVLASKVTLPIIAIGLGAQQIGVAYNRGIVAGHCGRISVEGDIADGCSMIVPLEYDYSELREFCDAIESQA